MRYAPGAQTSVEVALSGDGTMVVTVRNDASADHPGRTVGAGAGLVGLRERLRLFGGTLDARRRIGGGFELRARIPVDDRYADPAGTARAGIAGAAHPDTAGTGTAGRVEGATVTG